MVHCFDGVEGKVDKWRPAVALGTSVDHPSASLIFAQQCTNAVGRQTIGPGKQLFGHACANGGVVLRPGRGFHKVLCAHGKDHGAYCGSFCPHADPSDTTGPRCEQAWAVDDMGAYLRRETDAYREAPGWGHYNEFLLDGNVWDAALPMSIEAFLTSRGDGSMSKRAHDSFLERYGVSSADVPLLTMTRSLTGLLVVGTKFAEHGDPERMDFGNGWNNRPPYHFQSNEAPAMHGPALSPPPPLPPPHPPPPRPPPLPRVLDDLNLRFRNGRPSNDLEEVGIILKQFDGLERAGRPWEACEGRACSCQGATLPGRVSAMIAYKGLSDRADRRGIPLPFRDRSGVVLRNAALSLECLYGVDAATFNLKDETQPGCTISRCDTTGEGLCEHGSRMDDCAHGDLCGFSGGAPTAWQPSDLALMLTMHKKYGSEYKERTFHSGYNEVIIASATLNRRLPHSIAAFFTLDGAYPYAKGGDRDVGVDDVTKAHRDFLQRYGLSEAQVPLLTLTPEEWDTPFSQVDRR